MAIAEVELEVLRAGDPKHCKNSIVLIHGICHGAACWEKFLTFFSKAGYYCFAISLRGHFGSGRNKALCRCSLEDYAEDVRWAVEQCIEESGHKPFLIGHSMGGGVVQKYIGAHSDRVRGAVLFAPATAGGISRRGMLPGQGRSRAALAAMFGIKTWLETSAFFRGRGPELSQAKKLIQRESIQVLFSLTKPFTDRYPTDLPVLVIGTEKDSYFPRKELEKTAAAYHTTPVVLPGLCHDMMLDPEWQKPAEAVLRFMEQAPDPSEES